jgi:phenylalanyl-tRNA synthetase alpha chain
MEQKEIGHLHPITQITRDIFRLFREIGFTVAEGPELEDEFHNFDALNIPADHPARDMQDTFWIKSEPAPASSSPVGRATAGQKLPILRLASSGLRGAIKNQRKVLRTHTSSVQIRYMENHQPPVRIIVPGKAFRNEATDSGHEAQFHQIEVLYVDKKVSLAHLKGTLEYMFRGIFGPDVEIRFRPSFFSFTEPSLEVDMRWKDKWFEMVGSGLVHPNVFKAVGIDSREWQGFAFGCGLDRIAMLKFGIDDIRLFYTGDLRVINQF